MTTSELSIDWMLAEYRTISWIFTGYSEDK